jgi:hypothetical protein
MQYVKMFFNRSKFEDTDMLKNWDVSHNDLGTGKSNCTGALTVFTRQRQRGDSLTVEDSLCQLYHAEFSQVKLFFL